MMRAIHYIRSCQIKSSCPARIAWNCKPSCHWTAHCAGLCYWLASSLPWRGSIGWPTVLCCLIGSCHLQLLDQLYRIAHWYEQAFPMLGKLFWRSVGSCPIGRLLTEVGCRKINSTFLFMKKKFIHTAAFLSVLWIHIQSDQHHFAGSGSASRARRSRSGAGSTSISISTKCKPKLQYTFSRKLQ
jgi:hypothetical protein